MVAFVSATTANVNNGPSITVDAPAGIAVGDVLVAHLSLAKTSVTITAPSGWSLVRQDDLDTALRSAVYTRVVDGAEGASFAWSWGAGADAAAAIVAYSGVDTTTPVDVTGVGTGSTSPTLTAPSVTTTGPGDQVLSLFAIAKSTTLSIPGGTTSRAAVENALAVDSSLRIVDAAQAGAGATTARQSTSGTTFGWVATTVALRPTNNPPNAPILTAPANGSAVDRNSTNRFAWDFSDPDAGDSQSKFNLYYRLVGAPSWTTVTGTTPNSFYDMAAGTLAASDYEWQAETYDAQGVLGARSGSSFFTAGDAPPQPTITDPISGQTITVATYTATLSAPDVDASQWRTVADNAGAPDTTTVYQDSGVIESTTQRSYTLAFPVNNRTEHIQARIRKGGLWSQWADSTNPISYTPPTTPVVTLTPDDATGSLTVGITNPAPGAGEPATSYNDVYIDDGDGEERKVTMLAPNTTYTYRTSVSGRDYDGAVRVVATATTGTTASS